MSFQEDNLPDEAKDIHRAIKSMMEELEAVDWYNQRAAVATNPELKQILIHNRDEEIEHAVMTLEWLRRHMGKWDEELRSYLFSDGPIVGVEAKVMGRDGESPASANRIDLGLGSLKRK